MLHHGIIPVVLLCLTGQDRTLNARDLKQRQAWCYTASPIIIFYLQPQHWDMYQLYMATYTSLMYQQKGGTGDFSDHWQVSHKAGGNPWEGAKQPLTLLSCVIKTWGSKTMQSSAKVDPPRRCTLGRPRRLPWFPGDGKVSKKHTYSCQQLSEVFKSSFSRVINIFHNDPKGVFSLHWSYCTWQGSCVTFFSPKALEW